MSILLFSPVVAIAHAAGAAQGPRVYSGPPLSGIFGSASDFLSDPAGIGTVTKTSCTTTASGGTASPFGGSPTNVRVNCDSINLPHNEMAISVDPTNPSHLVAGSNDYELFFQGATVIERIIAGFYTSPDGGTTWTNGHVPVNGFEFSGDPAVAFNVNLNLVHYGVVAFNAGQGGGFADASVQVSTSSDGGATFGKPVTVALGTGGTRVTIFNDKPYITVDNNPTSAHSGRLYVTWTRFLFGQFGNYIESPIFLAFSDDGGQTFSAGKEISGSSSTFCTNPFIASNSGACNEDQFSSPVVGPDGTVYVAFENDEGDPTGEFRDQYLVVSSSDGGVTFGSPVQAVPTIFDGTNDYPININGRQTLSNSQFRVNSAGNLAVDPSSGPNPSATRLYIAYSDNSLGTLTGSFTTVQTSTTVFVVASTNGGSTWDSPAAVPKGGSSGSSDAFYPWVAVDSSGKVKVAFSDRSYDSGNVKYGETLATSSDFGVSFASTRVDSGLSNPNDSRWFTNGGATGGKATFIGDYNGLAIGPDGVARPLWTDMRNSVFSSPPPGRGHNTQDAVTTAA